MQSSGDQSSSDDVSWFRLVLKVTQGVLKPDAEAGDDASWFRFALGDIARQRICRRPPNPIIRLTQAAVLGGIAFERICRRPRGLSHRNVRRRAWVYCFQRICRRSGFW